MISMSRCSRFSPVRVIVNEDDPSRRVTYHPRRGAAGPAASVPALGLQAH